MTYAIGIDYSMTCPAACAYSPADVRFWYAHETKHYRTDQLQHFSHKAVGTVTQRAAKLAGALHSWLTQFEYSGIGIEDYAYAATGRVFHIGENTGVLKYTLEHAGIDYTPIPPTVIKKYATGKGNADKPKMTAAFLKAFPDAHDWVPSFFPRAIGVPVKSPLADLADAYWIARYQYDNPAKMA